MQNARGLSALVDSYLHFLSKFLDHILDVFEPFLVYSHRKCRNISVFWGYHVQRTCTNLHDICLELSNCLGTFLARNVDMGVGELHESVAERLDKAEFLQEVNTFLYILDTDIGFEALCNLLGVNFALVDFDKGANDGGPPVAEVLAS